jgi:hypothetical protein
MFSSSKNGVFAKSPENDFEKIGSYYKTFQQFKTERDVQLMHKPGRESLIKI